VPPLGSSRERERARAAGGRAAAQTTEEKQERKKSEGGSDDTGLKRGRDQCHVCLCVGRVQSGGPTVCRKRREEEGGTHRAHRRIGAAPSTRSEENRKERYR
jgi:hypothetical protein